MSPTDFFKANPLLQEYFETSDGKKFYTENAAQNHAKVKQLKNKEVKSFKRSEQIEESPEASTSVDKQLSKMTKAELKAKLTELGIDDLEGTNVELVERIEAALANGKEGSQTATKGDNTQA